MESPFKGVYYLLGLESKNSNYSSKAEIILLENYPSSQVLKGLAWESVEDKLRKYLNFLIVRR